MSDYSGFSSVQCTIMNGLLEPTISMFSMDVMPLRNHNTHYYIEGVLRPLYHHHASSSFISPTTRDTTDMNCQLKQLHSVSTKQINYQIQCFDSHTIIFSISSKQQDNRVNDLNCHSIVGRRVNASPSCCLQQLSHHPLHFRGVKA